ncbi:MAG: 2-dehydropantoate 2-reductase [Rhodobacteraceae bacterium]|nr:2-dehydropantoate 2-reductase [Paracoccaceae bacterium]MBL6639064.1 2-dehydropantoate 2-reductase [Paracoccaceae bacterium]MBL6677020.1 2-dehydropantoate 2-reductase [Paracoccaceae bacterium]MBL6788130.1 2-dehydropantoate 2-reductase [Paracoccaceae bacterium]MBL6859456.1 2-dehydropantoate 2-reductase [Paracoccaceae bacterium]
MTKICIFGAGAIGGYMAHALIKAGADVSLIARGPHLEGLRDNGLTLIKEGVAETLPVRATDTPEQLGPQDYVISALKAHSVAPVIDRFKPLLADHTALVPAVNGIPWWYFYKAGSDSAMENRWLETSDPGGVQWAAFGPERAIGCVVYPACEISAPGQITLKSGDRFTLGEPDGQRSERVMKLSELLRAGGLRAPVKPRLRDEIWIKLWGNCSFNPVSALTGASLDLIGNDPASRAVIRDAMIECRKVGLAVGARFNVDIERRIQGGADIIGHKPSTRHDVELGRPMELDALTSTVLELARRLEIETPTLNAISALVRLQGSVLGLYDKQDSIETAINSPYVPAEGG